jgi:lipopolysaccharide export system protein LptA
MSRARELRALAVLLGVTAIAGAAEPPRENAAPLPLSVPGLRRDQPITVTSRTLEYDYKTNVVVYRGDVQAEQGDVKLKSEALTIRLLSKDDKKTKDGGDTKANDAADQPPPTTDPKPAGDATLDGRVQVRDIEATGSVRIDQGDRWATGGRAVYDEQRRTLVLSENPVLHDGPNQIAGDRVVVYLDENRSVVEGGDKRVKAVLFPDQKQTAGGRTDTP